MVFKKTTSVKSWQKGLLWCEVIRAPNTCILQKVVESRKATYIPFLNNLDDEFSARLRTQWLLVIICKQLEELEPVMGNYIRFPSYQIWLSWTQIGPSLFDLVSNFGKNALMKKKIHSLITYLSMQLMRDRERHAKDSKHALKTFTIMQQNLWRNVNRVNSAA